MRVALVVWIFLLVPPDAIAAQQAVAPGSRQLHGEERRYPGTRGARRDGGRRAGRRTDRNGNRS